MDRRDRSRRRWHLRRKGRFLAGLVGLLGWACAQEPPPPASETVVTGPTMGTFYSVRIPGEHPDEEKQRFQELIQRELAAVDARMSTYRDDSELSALNASVSTDPVEVSEPLFEVLGAALDISRQTGGAYDITIGPVVNAWGFGPGGLEPEGVSPAAISELLDRVGYQKLRLDAEQHQVRKEQPDLFLDLSSIAKGYAVDRVALALEDEAVEDYWVEVGGEVRVAGHNREGAPWRLGIERPQLAPGSVQRILHLDGHAVATSGDYRNYREVDGERYSHILDPRTGWPIRHRLASVSIVHSSCMIADGLSTALLVMGPEEGYELAVQNDLAAFFVARKGQGFEERATPAFEELAKRR